jgi:hypothetical protein
LGIFWRALELKMLVYSWPFGIFDNTLVYLWAIRYILWSFGIFWVCCTKKNLATLGIGWKSFKKKKQNTTIFSCSVLNSFKRKKKGKKIFLTCSVRNSIFYKCFYVSSWCQRPWSKTFFSHF